MGNYYVAEQKEGERDAWIVLDNNTERSDLLTLDAIFSFKDVGMCFKSHVLLIQVL